MTSPNSIRSRFAPLLVRWRRNHNLTQEQAAAKLNIKRATYAAYEESRAEPGIETLNSMLRLNNKPTLDELLS